MVGIGDEMLLRAIMLRKQARDGHQQELGAAALYFAARIVGRPRDGVTYADKLAVKHGCKG